MTVLVAFAEAPGPFRYMELENLISDALDIKVDLVMEDALKPNIQERVLKEVVFL